MMTGSASPRVTIIGIGVQKAATSWLFQCLADHPEVGLAIEGRPTRKELNFFNRSWERGFGWYDDNFESGRKNLEFSVLYFHDRNVPERIHRYNPDARLLLCLREPAARAYSHHRHEFRRGRLPADRLDFWQALEANPSYLEQGRYATHLERWLEYFDRDQISIVLHGDVIRDPAAVTAATYRFVGVDPGFASENLGETINGPDRNRFDLPVRVVTTASQLVKKSLGSGAHAAIKSTGIGAAVRRANREVVDESAVPSLSDQDEARLRKIFREEVTRLEGLIDRDLSAWR